MDLPQLACFPKRPKTLTSQASDFAAPVNLQSIDLVASKQLPCHHHDPRRSYLDHHLDCLETKKLNATDFLFEASSGKVAIESYATGTVRNRLRSREVSSSEALPDQPFSLWLVFSTGCFACCNRSIERPHRRNPARLRDVHPSIDTLCRSPTLPDLLRPPSADCTPCHLPPTANPTPLLHNPAALSSTLGILPLQDINAPRINCQARHHGVPHGP